MKAVIMAGGLGKRLRPFTEILPKPLLPVGDSSLLSITVKHLAKHGFDQVFIATGYKSEYIEAHLKDGSDYGIKITYSKEPEKLGTAGPLNLLKKHLTEPFLVMNGDILTNMDFGKLFRDHKKSPAVMTIVSKRFRTPLDYGVIEAKKGYITKIREKPVMTSDINAGIYILDPVVLDDIMDGHDLMTDVIRRVIDKGMKVRKHMLSEYWLDIGQMDDYQKAKDDVRNGVVDL